MEISKESVEEIDNAIEAENMKKVEAALFIAGRFMSLQELVALTDVNPIFLKKILEDLGDRYKDSGIEVIKRDNLWKMDVSQEYVWMVNKLATGSSEFSKAEQETLAIIAYKQPIKQSVIVKIRGNKAYEHIKRYVEMGLVNKKKTGHTAELSLNDRFHEYFHVNTSQGNEKLEMLGVIGQDIEVDENAGEDQNNEKKENEGKESEVERGMDEVKEDIDKGEVEKDQIQTERE
ncbi:SMC-Scp complex subunit ScpB [Candidatus Pacearchaeota archaeon]|nr:SMC-Scp complex subunit ScpB [Candidatus Pacearchaeota archaeon]